MEKRYPPLCKDKLSRQVFIQKVPDGSPDYWVIRDEYLNRTPTIEDSSRTMRFPTYREAQEEADRNHAATLASGFSECRWRSQVGARPLAPACSAPCKSSTTLQAQCNDPFALPEPTLGGQFSASEPLIGDDASREVWR
jgi:hypothetical protein